jgi:hypothetical protein
MTEIVKMVEVRDGWRKVNIISFNAIEFIENWHATCTKECAMQIKKALSAEKPSHKEQEVK